MAAAKSRVVKRFIIIRFRFVFMTYDIFFARKRYKRFERNAKIMNFASKRQIISPSRAEKGRSERRAESKGDVVNNFF